MVADDSPIASEKTVNESLPELTAEESLAPPPTPSPHFYYSTRNPLQVNPDSEEDQSAEELEENSASTESPSEAAEITSSEKPVIEVPSSEEPEKEPSPAEEIISKEESQASTAHPVTTVPGDVEDPTFTAGVSQKPGDSGEKFESWQKEETADYIVEPELTKLEPTIAPPPKFDPPVFEETSKSGGTLDEIMDACRQSKLVCFM